MTLCKIAGRVDVTMVEERELMIALLREPEPYPFFGPVAGSGEQTIGAGLERGAHDGDAIGRHVGENQRLLRMAVQ